ncbi:MAG: GLPGLI family protein [Parafilimonas sp.]|nr:GLPGLI family protein [Parafilimonas sp.]
MKKFIITFFSLFIIHCSLFAQDIFISQGKIEFEKKVNVYKSLDDQKNNDDQDGGFDWISQIKKQVPEWNVTYFNLFFDGDKTLYKPGRESTQTQKMPDWFQDPAQSNTVYCDLKSDQSVSQKSVFESVFLINDSLRKIKWKISNDTRDIAGFRCRKATAIIMDSVFVIAFYTDQITTSGGPESFNNLPGMILGLAVPRLHTTWFATKVESVDPAPTDLAAPTKGKKAKNEELVQKLKSTMKDWGKFGQHAQWIIEL